MLLFYAALFSCFQARFVTHFTKLLVVYVLLAL